MLSTHLIEKIREQVLSDEAYSTMNYHVVACALVGKTYFVGLNLCKTHPEAHKTFDNGKESALLHAEIDALVKVPRDSRSKVQLFVFRFLKNGELSMAKPCAMCQSFLAKYGIDHRRIFHTDWNGEWQRMG